MKIQRSNVNDIVKVELWRDDSGYWGYTLTDETGCTFKHPASYSNADLAAENALFWESGKTLDTTAGAWGDSE